MYVILGQFLLELCLAAPGRILPPVVGQQFFRHTVLPDCTPVCLEHVLRRLATVEPEPCHVPGVIIDESDDVGVLAKYLEDRDIALPELVRLRVFEPPVRERLHTMFLLPRRCQTMGLRVLPDHRRACFHEEQPPEHVGKLPRSACRVRLLQLHDLFDNCFRQPGLLPPARPVMQSGLAFSPIAPCPFADGRVRYAQFLRHQRYRYPFFHCQLHGLAPYRLRIPYPAV